MWSNNKIHIFILRSKYNFLFRNLIKKGYTNVIEVESGIPYAYREGILTIFSPFSSHLYHESNIGNLIDSALVVEDRDGTSAFNANDNTPDINSCKILRNKYGSFDLAMINYNAAGHTLHASEISRMKKKLMLTIPFYRGILNTL